jgi:hypothetical protein
MFNYKTEKEMGSKSKVNLKEIQGYSRRSIHIQEFILQVLLNAWRRAVHRLK